MGRTRGLSAGALPLTASLVKTDRVPSWLLMGNSFFETVSRLENLIGAVNHVADSSCAGDFSETKLGGPQTAVMLRKEVYVNDQLVGEARTWREVDALLESKGILFLDKPGAAEGPTG